MVRHPLAAALLLALAAPAALAQSADAPSPGTLDTIIVTGTRVADRTVAESQSPIDIIGSEALQATGTTELATALARALSPGLTREARDASRIDAGLYPMPDLAPDGGFVIERAMVYAIARKETGFNARARSGAGAYGMMQVMPTTAAELAGDPGFARQPDRLYDPATNLRLGQAYVTKMLNLPAFQGDMLRMASSYNAGPGPMIKAIRQLGMDADPLLLIETIEVPQARDYVEKVVAAYWIYQRLMGRPVNTLKAVASGARAVPISLDYVAPPPPAPIEVAAVIETVGVAQ